MALYTEQYTKKPAQRRQQGKGPRVAPLHTEYSSRIINLECAHRLALAILYQAIKDAMNASSGSFKQAHARNWLLSEDAAFYLSETGFSPEKMADWVKAGCPLPDPDQYKAAKPAPDDTCKAILMILKGLKSEVEHLY